MEFVPQNEDECAGLALVQNKDFHFLFVVTQTAQPVDLINTTGSWHRGHSGRTNPQRRKDISESCST